MKTVHYKIEGNLDRVLNLFNSITARLKLPKVKTFNSASLTIYEFYRACVYFNSHNNTTWTTKLHINEIGIIILFQKPGCVIKLHHSSNGSYVDFRIKPILAPIEWGLITINLYNLSTRDRGWAMRNIRKHPTEWFQLYDKWVPSYITNTYCRI